MRCWDLIPTSDSTHPKACFQMLVDALCSNFLLAYWAVHHFPQLSFAAIVLDVFLCCWLW